MIYDCFTFFNELEVLEIRLHELCDVVDKFVLVEATLTHQGKPKELIFDKHKERFKAFEHQIIHIVIDEYPPEPYENAWVLERWQRNMIMKGLAHCQPNDVVIVSDVDEIPSKAAIKRALSISGIKILKQKMFYYFLNCTRDTGSKRLEDSWMGSVICSFKDLDSPQAMRQLSIGRLAVFHTRWLVRTYFKLRFLFQPRYQHHPVVTIADGGWHFSYLGGTEKIIKKIESFAHTEYNKEEYKDITRIEKAINSGEDIFGRDMRYKFIPVDERFPDYIYRNQDLYKHLIK